VREVGVPENVRGGVLAGMSHHTSGVIFREDAQIDTCADRSNWALESPVARTSCHVMSPTMSRGLRETLT